MAVSSWSAPCRASTPGSTSWTCWRWTAAARCCSRRDPASGRSRLHLAACQGAAYAAQGPWGLSFNTEDRDTRAPVVDLSRPADLLVTGSAPAPKAGKGDLYRVAVPTLRGADGCMPGA